MGLGHYPVCSCVHSTVLSHCVSIRFGSRELIGGIAVQLEHADLFGLTVNSRIEEQSTGLEVR